MTYASLSLGFLLVAMLVAVLVFVGLGVPRPPLRAWLLAGAALLLLTAVFDSVMINAGLFTYPEEHLLGIRIGLAPIEDFAYPIAAVVLLPALWMLLRKRRDR